MVSRVKDYRLRFNPKRSVTEGKKKRNCVIIVVGKVDFSTNYDTVYFSSNMVLELLGSITNSKIYL